jgi:hypothetical protein
MVTEDHKLDEALEQVRMALAAMGSGNPEPYINCWAESEDVTLFGAWGPIDKPSGVSRRRFAEWAIASGAGNWCPSIRSFSRAGTLPTPSASSGARWSSMMVPRGRWRFARRTSIGGSATRGGWCIATPIFRPRISGAPAS